MIRRAQEKVIANQIMAKSISQKLLPQNNCQLQAVYRVSELTQFAKFYNLNCPRGDFATTIRSASWTKYTNLNQVVA